MTEKRFHGSWPTVSGGPNQQHLCLAAIHHYMATWQGGTQFPHCLWNTINQWSTVQKMFSAVFTLSGREGLPYLVSRNGKRALAVRREIAVHPSQALLLITRVEQIAQTGRKHTGLSPQGQAGQVLKIRGKTIYLSPLMPPPCMISVPVAPAMGSKRGLSEWTLISRLSRYKPCHSVPHWQQM